MKFILVVARQHLFPGLSPQGFLPLDAVDLDVVGEHGFFAERDYMERCSHYKQPIPYIALTLEDRVLCYQRRVKHTEARLGGLWTVGFGGHIEPFDRPTGSGGAAMLQMAAQRELEEETGLELDPSALQARGCINSEREDVSSVHVGVFFTADLAELGRPHDEIAATVRAQAEPHEVVWRSRAELASASSGPKSAGLPPAPTEDGWEDWTRIVLGSGVLD
jgi:predicted NUDIX family phosphoesterase